MEISFEETTVGELQPGDLWCSPETKESYLQAVAGNVYFWLQELVAVIGVRTAAPLPGEEAGMPVYRVRLVL